MNELLPLVLRHNLHPELDLHPSWLPPAWPARHRRLQRLNASGRAMLAAWLRRDLGTPDDYRFDTPLRRLALLDGPSLRRLALYAGLGVHQGLLAQRSTARQLRRQAQRLAEDGSEFVTRRMPAPTAELRMNTQRLVERPASVGRVVAQRGYRLLLGLVRCEDEALMKRVQRKLPRHAAAVQPPALTPRQADQLRELMLLCIVPERLPQWDWLF